MTLTVHPVRTRADLRAFLAGLDGDRRRRTHGVPLWHSTVRSWWRGTGPHRTHGPVRLFLVRDRSGAVRGRTTLHTDTRMDAKLGERTLLLGATEFADAGALAVIVRHAEERARLTGRSRLLGPVSLLPNQVGGVVTAGFDEPGFLDSVWNPEHYPGDWEGLGFQRVWEGATWRCAGLGALDPAGTFGVDPLPEGVRLRHADRRRLGEQLPVLREMLNAAFAELGYFTRIEADELAAATDGLAHLLDERLLLWLEQDDAPVAFVLVVPDLTAFVRSTGGRLSPVDIVRLLLTRGRHRQDAVLIIKGTVPGARGHGLMRHLSRELLQGLQAGGYETLRVTFVEDDNAGSQAQFRAMGGAPLHRTCFYSRAIEPGTGPEQDQDTPAGRVVAREADWGRAPSAHNTQPWRVRALDDRTIGLGWYADRELPVADATRRDLMLSLGAVALSLQVVAAALGLRTEVDWDVRPDQRAAARLRLLELSASAEPVSELPWQVSELHHRATDRGPFARHPDPEQIATLARHAGLGPEAGLLDLPDDLVDRLLPGATAHTLTGPAAEELSTWLRLDPRHPRHDVDGLSARVLRLSRAEARGMRLLTGSAALRGALARGRLDRLVANAAAVRPRGAVVALWSEPGLPLDRLGHLGGSLMAAWLAGERAGWSAHPLSELVDEPGSAAALHRHVSHRTGGPAQVYAVWRWGRGTTAPPRSPRRTW
ncbi:hypothetical protein ACI3EY_13670 [Ornithinimicrobium sp. LYQ92]|uniref:hypothetical protein n=1 Tax=Serinicoccus sp. LYQ92 TaxID=3378798 RepID=UPI003852D3C5